MATAETVEIVMVKVLAVAVATAATVAMAPAQEAVVAEATAATVAMAPIIPTVEMELVEEVAVVVAPHINLALVAQALSLSGITLRRISNYGKI